MEELRKRQQEVLEIIVNKYIQTVNPVGSKVIAECFRDQLSPATIRNEMHSLETMDYITHPHTSAGRVPTDKGYRYYVDRLMRMSQIDPKDAEFIENEYRNQMDNMETLIKRTSRILSTLSHQAGIVSFPMFEELVFKQVELTLLGKRHLLVVWMTENGFVQDRVIDMTEEIPADEIHRLNNFLNDELKGLVLRDIKFYLAHKLEEAHDSLREIYEKACALVLSSFPQVSMNEICVEGSHYILEQPEFQNLEKSKQLFRVLEEKNEFAHLMNINLSQNGVQISIGIESQCDSIRDCSFVAAQYFMKQRPVGKIGILGPRRMAYRRVVAIVDYLAGRFGEILEQW